MQYSVKGSDGNTYGPVDLPTLKQWSSEGRVLPSTMVINHVTNQSVIASQMPELGLSAASNPYAAPPAPQAYPRSFQEPGKYSGPSHLGGIIFRVCIGVLLSLFTYIGGLIVTAYALFYGFQSYQSGDPKGKVGLVIGGCGFVFVVIVTIIKVSTHTVPFRP